MSFGNRLREAIEKKGETYRAFSERTGIPYRTLQQYLRDERAPGAEALIKILTHSDISLYHLLLGVGEMYHEQPVERPYTIQECSGDGFGIAEISPETMRGRQKELSLEDLQAVEQLRWLKALELGKVALFARRGSQAGAWHVLNTLERHAPEAFSLARLAEKLETTDGETDVHDLAADVTFLLHSQLALEEEVDGEKRYRAASTDGELRSETLADIHQHALEAIRTLLRVVLPATAARNERGHLVTLEVGVPEGEGEKLLEEVMNLVHERARAAAREGAEERLSIVLGLGLSGKAQQDSDGEE